PTLPPRTIILQLNGDARGELIVDGVVFDVAFFFQNTRNLYFDARLGNIHRVFASQQAITDARQHIGDWVVNHRGLLTLPTRLHDAGNFALQRQFTEVDAAQPKTAHVPTRTPTGFPAVGVNILAAIADAHFIFTLAFALNHRGFCHRLILLKGEL